MNVWDYVDTVIWLWLGYGMRWGLEWFFINLNIGLFVYVYVSFS
jgi:hypothetical protein